MEKEFKTIEEQIEILISRNIIITDFDRAYDLLSKNNYYYLINGYKNLFIDSKSKEEKFIDKTELDELYSLYYFDKKIKINFLKYLLLIENELDSFIAYEFSKSYGHKEYLTLSNFNNLNSNKLIIQKFLDDINLEIKHQYRNSNKMIIHYLDNYKYIPLWVLVRIMSFGKLSKFYSLMKPKDQNKISKKYNLAIKDLKIMMHNLTLIRNICAHDEKLYDIRLKSRIPSNIYHKELNITSFKGNYQLGTRDLFSIVIIFKILLEKQDFYEFFKKLVRDIKILQRQIHSIKFEKVLKAMGFPKNYKKLLK